MCIRDSPSSALLPLTADTLFSGEPSCQHQQSDEPFSSPEPARCRAPTAEPSCLLCHGLRISRDLNCVNPSPCVMYRCSPLVHLNQLLCTELHTENIKWRCTRDWRKHTAIILWYLRHLIPAWPREWAQGLVDEGTFIYIHLPERRPAKLQQGKHLAAISY